MIDCTKTKNFLREKHRMCKMHERCCECPLDKARKQENIPNMLCSKFCAEYPQKAIEIVQKWSDEHPRKTFLDDFREKYPNAPLNENGSPKICPYDVGYEKESDNNCYNDCKTCWCRPFEEEQK